MVQFRSTWILWSCGVVVVWTGAVAGCQYRQAGSLPAKERLVRDQLVFHSDFRLPRRHRLLDELVAQRDDIRERLLLPGSDEPINVYLFEDETRFQSFLRKTHPRFPNRRAFFVKDDTSLNVYAFWGERVAEDLRHEVTHGYLHAVVPNLPLWLDEGLAEYFEVPRGQRGFNRPHVLLLLAKLTANDWQPDLTRLEQLNSPHQMNQLDYAESWLWVHFLLETAEDHAPLIQHHLARLRMTGRSTPLSESIAEVIDEPDRRLLDHLADLAEQL